MNQAQRVSDNVTERAPERPLSRLMEACKLVDQRSIESLLALYANDVYYEDPYKALQGKNEFLEYCRNFLGERTAFIRVITSIQDSDSFFISWSARLEAGKRAVENRRVEGASHFKTRSGLIYFQRNYFDLG